MQYSFQIDCHGTKHFYTMVSVLNQQIGIGKWTTQGRPLRKLRRLSINNEYRKKYKLSTNTLSIRFFVPEEHASVESALGLWGDIHGT